MTPEQLATDVSRTGRRRCRPSCPDSGAPPTSASGHRVPPRRSRPRGRRRRTHVHRAFIDRTRRGNRSPHAGRTVQTHPDPVSVLRRRLRPARRRRGRTARCAVRGDADHPANRGRTCRKPLGLPFAVHAPDRATTPLLARRSRRALRAAPAGTTCSARSPAGCSAIVDEHGPDAVAFYISGQLLTEDYYAVNKLAKGFLGTNNVDSNSRLCMSSAVAGYSGAFGFDGPPPAYADLALADCFLLLGTNTAACHPIVWSRIRDRQAEGAFVICADPRATPTARGADLHLPVRPGHRPRAAQRAAARHRARRARSTSDFVARHTTGWEEARAVARELDARARGRASAASRAELIERAAHRFAERGRARWRCGRWAPTSRRSAR